MKEAIKRNKRAYHTEINTIWDVSKIDYEAGNVELCSIDGNQAMTEAFEKVKLLDWVGYYDVNGVPIYEGDVVQVNPGLSPYEYVVDRAYSFVDDLVFENIEFSQYKLEVIRKSYIDSHYYVLNGK